MRKHLDARERQKDDVKKAAKSRKVAGKVRFALKRGRAKPIMASNSLFPKSPREPTLREEVTQQLKDAGITEEEFQQLYGSHVAWREDYHISGDDVWSLVYLFNLHLHQMLSNPQSAAAVVLGPFYARLAEILDTRICVANVQDADLEVTSHFDMHFDCFIYISVGQLNGLEEQSEFGLALRIAQAQRLTSIILIHHTTVPLHYVTVRCTINEHQRLEVNIYDSLDLPNTVDIVCVTKLAVFLFHPDALQLPAVSLSYISTTHWP